MNVRIPSIASIETAIRIFYEYPELGSEEIQELFGHVATGTVTKLKRLANDKSAQKGTPVFNVRRVNTDDAYEAWGLDIAKLEARYSRLVKLGLRKEAGAK